MGPTRTVAICGLVTDLLQQLLESSTGTELLICSTRTEFLVQLSAVIRSQRIDERSTLRHDLLTKTIGLLANSSKVQLTFCPSLESLRAYLAVLPRTKRNSSGADLPGTQQTLVILDMIALHAATTEFSAQGLSRSMAAAVESAFCTGLDLVLCECTNAVDPTSARWGDRLWDTHVPLLNGSVQLRGEGGTWSGRGVSVKQVAQRWFEFDEGREREKQSKTDGKRKPKSSI